MWPAWFSQAIVLLLVQQAIANNASLDFGEENRTNVALLQGSLFEPFDPLQGWLVGLEIPVPVNVSGEMPMGMGIFTAYSGHCKGLKVGKVEVEDLSSGLTLEFALKVSGLGVSCFVQGYSEGPVDINITLEGSALNATVQIQPYRSEEAEDLPLPLGPLNVTSCNADLLFSHFKWAGSGRLVETLTDVGDGVKDLIGMFINEPLCDGLKTFLEVNGTAALQLFAANVSQLLAPPKPAPQPRVLKPVLAWDEYPPFEVLQVLLAERFSMFSKKMLSILDVTSFNTTLVDEDNVSLALSTLQIQGRAGDAPIMQIGAQQSNLNLSADLAGMTISSGLDLSVYLQGRPTFNQHIDVVLGLQQVAIGVRAMVDKAALDDLELDDALSSPRCLAQCTDGIADPAQEAVAVESILVQLRPMFEVHCSGALATYGSQMINTVLSALFRGYLPTMNALVNGGLGVSRGRLGQILWNKINEAPTCGREDMFFVLSEGQVLCLLAIAVCLAVLGAPAAAIAHAFMTPRKAADGTPAGCTAANPTIASPAAAAGTPAAAACDAAAARAVSASVSLACDPCVPRFMAIYYPFAICAVMVLFMYADLDIGTTVSMVMEAKGMTSEIGPLFSFSLASTVAHAWSSEAYVIAVITVIASGIWPFAKLSLLLAAWLVPPRYLSLHKRGKVLQFLDTWGKYSFLDSWFLVLTLSAFALEWQSLGNGTASLKIQTTPAPAFYTFFAATALSLILGHVASEYHRSTAARAAPCPKASALELDDGMEESNTDTKVQEPMRLCALAESSIERVLVLVAVGTTALLATLGMFLTSFEFEISGILTQFLFGDSIQKSYSLFYVGISVASGRYRDSGLLGLEMAFVVLAVVLPALLLGLLCALWVVPMRLGRQTSLLHACRLLDAWASMDVAAFALAIACFEFGKMAEWLVYQGNFAAPCQLVKNLTQEECMLIDLKSYPTLVLLFFAGVCMIVVPKVSMRRCSTAIAKRSSTAS